MPPLPMPPLPTSPLTGCSAGAGCDTADVRHVRCSRVAVDRWFLRWLMYARVLCHFLCERCLHCRCLHSRSLRRRDVWLRYGRRSSRASFPCAACRSALRLRSACCVWAVLGGVDASTPNCAVLSRRVAFDEPCDVLIRAVRCDRVCVTVG